MSGQYQATAEYFREHLRRHCAACNHGHRGFDRCIEGCDCPKHILRTKEMIDAYLAERDLEMALQGF